MKWDSPYSICGCPIRSGSFLTMTCSTKSWLARIRLQSTISLAVGRSWRYKTLSGLTDIRPISESICSRYAIWPLFGIASNVFFIRTVFATDFFEPDVRILTTDSVKRNTFPYHGEHRFSVFSHTSSAGKVNVPYCLRLVFLFGLQNTSAVFFIKL